MNVGRFPRSHPTRPRPTVPASAGGTLRPPPPPAPPAATPSHHNRTIRDSVGAVHLHMGRPVRRPEDAWPQPEHGSLWRMMEPQAVKGACLPPVGMGSWEEEAAHRKDAPHSTSPMHRWQQQMPAVSRKGMGDLQTLERAWGCMQSCKDRGLARTRTCKHWKERGVVCSLVWTEAWLVPGCPA